jgi:hypothetical protein
MAAYDLTPEQRATLDALLPMAERTGDARKDWAAAVRVAMWRREENTRLGAAAIAELRAQGVTWRDLQALTNVPWATARRWHESPVHKWDRPPNNAPADTPPELHLGHAS